MNIIEEKLANATVKLTIDIPVEKVENEYQTIFKKIQKNAKIDGFRKGKAPVEMVETRYKEHADLEVAESLAKSALHDAVTEKNLVPIAQPSYEFDDGISRDKPFKFSATFEVPPTVELGKYRDISVSERTCKITDDDVMKEIESVRERKAKVDPKPDDAQVIKDDLVKVKVKRIDDTDDPESVQYKEYNIVVGKSSDQYAIDKNIEGMKKNEEKEVTIKYPKDYYMKEFAGQKVTYSVLVAEISDMELPELTDDFAKEENYESVEDMKLKIKEYIESYIGERLRGEAKSSILKNIMDHSKFDIPNSMIQSEMNTIFNRTAQRFGIQAESIDEFCGMVGIPVEEFEQRIREEAEQSVKTTLVLSEIAKQENFQVEEGKYGAMLEKIAMNYGKSVPEIEEIIAQNNSRQNVEYEILIDMSMDFIYDMAKISKSKPITVEKLMAENV